MTNVKIHQIYANATQLEFQSSNNAEKFISMEDLELSRYVVAIYDRNWYIGMVEDVSTEHRG